ncbi:MAG TPA: GNAT family protein [Jatrophihabitans sp.]|nr:GNAT family protein [Jatrophihabitans sp.]
MIRGERVLLRPVTPDDHSRLVEFKNDIELDLLGGGPPPRPITLAQVGLFLDGMAREGNLLFAIEADGRFIGYCGLLDFDRVSGTAEFSITIGDRAYWGKGFGREAARLLADYGFRLQNLRKITLKVFAGNERAIRSYLAAGFVEEGRQRAQVWSAGGYQDVVLMAAFRDGAGG